MILAARSRKFTVVFLFVIAFVLLFSQTAHAIPTNLVGGVSPMSSQISAGGPHPFHNLIMSDHGKVQSVLVGMYWPNNGDKNFQINVGDCDMRPGGNYRSHKRFLAVEVNGTVRRYFDGNEACNGTLANHVFTISNGELQANFRDSTMFGARVQMRWINDSEANACNGGANSCLPIRTYLSNVGSGENNGSRIRFRFNPLGGNARAGLIDSSNATTSNTNNSIVFTHGGFQDLYIPFGLSCSITNPRANELASVYDADNGTATQSTPLYFYVGTLDANGNVTPLSRAEYGGNGGGAATSLGDIWINENPNGTRSGVSRPLVSAPNGYPIFTPSNFNNVGGVTSVRVFRVEPQTKYALIIRNQHAGQFTYIGLPGDALFGSPDFECANQPGNLTSSVSLTGDTGGVFEPGQTADADATVRNTGGDATASWARQFWYERNGNDSPDGAEVFRQQTGRQLFVRGNTDFANWTTPINAAEGRICTRLTLLTNPAPDPPDSRITNGPAVCKNIERRPYFNVMNGDVNAAAVMAPTCTAGGTLTNIAAFARGSGGTFQGANTQIAAFSRGIVDQFASSRGTSTSVKRLTFANNSGAQTYGGSFRQFYCIPNYWSGLPNTNHANITAAQTANVLTSGDVFVSGSPLVNSAGIGNVPNLRWVIADDIYISNAVTRLDGIYIARNNIYTCSTALGAPVGGNPMVGQCAQALTINGALIAGNTVKLQRTTGHLNGGPAETILYNPFVWMQGINPNAVPPVGGPSGRLDSITSLPPIL